MKHYALLVLLFCAFTLSGTAALAQDRHSHERKENVEAAKVAYLTDKMGLTPEQAQKFWPIYNEHEAKRRELVKGYRIDFRQDVDALTDEQVQARVDKIFDLKAKELALDKEYSYKYQKVISVKQLVKLYRGERAFTKLLLRRLDDKKVNQ